MYRGWSRWKGHPRVPERCKFHVSLSRDAPIENETPIDKSTTKRGGIVRARSDTMEFSLTGPFNDGNERRATGFDTQPDARVEPSAVASLRSPGTTTLVS